MKKAIDDFRFRVKAVLRNRAGLSDEEWRSELQKAIDLATELSANLYSMQSTATEIADACGDRRRIAFCPLPES